LSRGLFLMPDPPIPDPVPATIEHLSGKAVTGRFKTSHSRAIQNQPV
jgi:hypothetical protein